MSRMKVRFLGRRRDAGGVAVIAGILLSAGVLLGASALVVDVGQLYVEREELQSAADAAAMAVALDCLHGRKDACESGTNAEHFADLNSRDGQSNVAEVCGDDFVDWLATCSDAEPDNLTACIGDLPLNTTGWVKVRTSTERSAAAGSRYILSPTFAQTLAGGHNGTSVGACSLVAWGAPDVSFAFAVCENIYDEYTDDGEDLAPAPPAPGLAAYEHEFLWRPGVPYNGLCDDRGGSPYSDGRWPVRADFGWGDRDFMGDDCEVDMSHDYDTTQLAPDEPPFTPDECYFRLVDARDTTDPLPVLVYRQVSPDWFEIRGLAAFVVTGYRIEFRPDADSSITGDPCGPDTSVCISGYFTGALIPGERLKPSDDWPYGTFGAAPDWGASIMQTVGFAGYHPATTQKRHKPEAITGRQGTNMTRRIVGVLVAIVLAVIGTGAVLAYLTAARSAVAEGQEAVTVRIAKARIPAGTTGAAIREKGLTEAVVMPRTTLPDDVMPDISIDFDKLVLTSDVQPRQLLLKGLFGQSTKLSGGIAVPDKLMAISGKYAVEREVGGFVRPGSVVAVFSTCKIIDAAFKKKNEEDRRATFVLLPRMEVLAVGAYGEDGQTSTATAEQRARQDAKGNVTLIVTLAATQDDATRLVHATDLGCSLTLALLTDSSVVQVGGMIDNGSPLR